jgi:hypothetical protein
MKNVWKIIGAIGLILGIIASVNSLWNSWKINQVAHRVQIAKGWRITINLKEPENHSEVRSYVLKIKGHVDFQTTATEAVSSPKVSLALSENDVELIPFVRPFSEAKWWWVQSIPVVGQDGSFESSVFVGERSGVGIGIEFQIVVLAIPRKSVSEGDKLVNLPFYYATSNIVTVKRIQ